MIADVVVIGGGPAGVAAAVAIAESGTRVVLIDGGDRLGGQYFRHPHNGTEKLAKVIGGSDFVQLMQRFTAQRQRTMATYLSRSVVWSVSDNGETFTLRIRKGERDRQAIEIVAKNLVIAAGAYDRALPFNGWTLPGSMTLGAAQSMVKGNGVLPGTSIVVAGTGPFLLATAVSLIEAGAHVSTLVERNRIAAMSRYPRALIAGRDKLTQAVRYLAILKKSRVNIFENAQVAAAHSQHGDRINSVSIATERGTVKVDADTVATGWGFTPNLDLPIALGVATKLGVDGVLSVTVDDNQKTSHPRIWAAGETTGIAGVDAALVEGEIAGNAVVSALGGRAVDTSKLKSSRRRLHTFASYLPIAYPVPQEWPLSVDDDVMVCRCEEVTAGEIRQAADLHGASNPRLAKLFTRAGMGWCQGRMCAQACSDIIESATGASATVDSTAAAHKRIIATPITLGTLAEWDERHV